MLNLGESDPFYKGFNGTNLDELMAVLIEEGRTPLSVAGLMEKRLEVLTGCSDEVKSAWWDNHFTVGDGVVYHPDGPAKIVLGAQLFRNMTSKSVFDEAGALVLGEDRSSSISIYDSANGVEFNRRQLESFGALHEGDVVASPVWTALVSDRSLLKEYASVVFAREKEHLKKLDCGFLTALSMDVHIFPIDTLSMFQRPNKEFATGRLLNVDGGSKGYSGLSVEIIGGYNEGCLVGILPR